MSFNGDPRSSRNREDTETKSGFMPYPTQGFQIQPPGNYWQGGNFMMPGISNSPIMTSSIMDQFPMLRAILLGQSPPPTPGGGMVGAMPNFRIPQSGGFKIDTSGR